MVERLFILKNMNMNNESENDQMSKNQSFNTDEDDSLQTGVDNSKRSVGFLASPSIDSINDPEGSISDIPLSEKLKRKKQRRSTLRPDSIEYKRSPMKTRPWYTNVDLTKPILFLLFLCLIYLMWVKRDVWIPRLLTSNSRIRHTIQRNEDKPNTKEDLIINKDSSTNQDNIINDNQLKKDQNSPNDNNDNNNDDNNDDDGNNNTPTPSNKQTPQKMNLRIRRNKMSFTRDKQSKSNKYSKYRIVDDDDGDDDDEDEDEDDEDDLINEEVSTKSKQIILPSSIHSSKKNHHHHHRSDHSHKSKISSSDKTSVILRPHDDIVEQLRKLIKSHGKHRDFLQILTKETGLNKAKLFKFVQQKDFSVITLDNLLSLLNSFHSTILIVPK